MVFQFLRQQAASAEVPEAKASAASRIAAPVSTSPGVA